MVSGCRIISVAREIAACRFCPAFLALRGPGKMPRTMSGRWPLPLNLAPYVDAVLLGAAEVEMRA